MRTAAEIAEERVMPADEHKKRSAAIRRIATGVRAEIASKITGLSEDEIKTLQRAEAILSKLATLHQGAGNIRRREEETLQKAMAGIRASMATNFARLSLVADRVALIAAVNSFVLTGSRAELLDLSDVDYLFDEALSSLTYRLAKEVVTTKQKPSDAVSSAWAKFGNGKVELIVRYEGLISRLSGARTAQGPLKSGRMA